MNPRRLTPSMSLILAFEASGRHLSFTRAANELALTQSAVSRQVQALEAQIETSLFKRDGRRIELTAVGARYLYELSAALGRIRSATLQTISFRSQDETLHLAVLPTFASKWLLPRISDFYTRHPEIVVHIHSRIIPEHVANTDVEMNAVICVGKEPWPGFVSHKLLAEKLVVVASPTLMQDCKDIAPADLTAKHLLLNVVSRPHAWSDWLEQNGLNHTSLREGPSFEITAHLIQAVVAGIGVGLVPQILVQDEVRSGALVTLFEPIDIGRSYFLAYANRYQHLPSLVKFSEWLRGLPFPDA
ncbi:LysR family transcriptional regulator [Pseudomonas sp. CCM 7893]|uniref:LysR family transcriptional regulator n=1 Tax=Pseudomonas spelaei TaxID=1055469 RepID=A0A6I3WJ83_9PSED|nr:LysR substrate-binding domain-containing protein [Pseudomonas spelaei]MUF08271.1 LysR family transcriptional regulator [Pseudomonas spelaei]